MTDEIPATAAKNASELFGSNRMWGLKELADPEPISYLPQTIGWAGLAFIVLCLGFWQIWQLYVRWKQNDYRRDAVVRMRRMLNGIEGYRKLPEILRIVAFTSFSREEVVELRSEHYGLWLNKQLEQPVFNPTDMSLLDQISYLPDTQLPNQQGDVNDLIEKCILWVAKHHVSV
jgi:Domain of unknown function (DUF4381)